MTTHAGDEPLCFLFTGLVGQTELADTVGDERAHALRRDHFQSVRAALAQHLGCEVTTAGDRVTATFRSAVDAVRCGVNVQAAAGAGDVLTTEVTRSLVQRRGDVAFDDVGPLRLNALERLRWITFGHVESDECGSMNAWLATAPSAQVVFIGLSCMVSVADLAGRAPRVVPATRCSTSAGTGSDSS